MKTRGSVSRESMESCLKYVFVYLHYCFLHSLSLSEPDWVMTYVYRGTVPLKKKKKKGNHLKSIIALEFFLSFFF